MFENIRNDYRMYRSFLHPALWVLVVYRFGRWTETIKTDLIRRILDKTYWIIQRIVSTITTIDLTRGVTFGKNLHIIHPISIVIHPKTIIGDNVGIMHEVTIGSRGTYAAPVIGNNVFIGVGAKILGEITIGDNVDIGANSVVLTDVPPNSLVVGIPGRIIENHVRKKWEYEPES